MLTPKNGVYPENTGFCSTKWGEVCTPYKMGGLPQKTQNIDRGTPEKLTRCIHHERRAWGVVDRKNIV